MSRLRIGRVLLSSLMALGLLMGGSVYAQTQIEDAKIVAGDGAGGDHFGSSIATDGDRMAVGAFRDDGKGSAYVYEFDGTNWQQQTKVTHAARRSGDHFGNAVSVLGDRLLVGAPTDEPPGKHINDNWGSVSAFNYNGSSWVSQGFLSQPSNAGHNSRVGTAIAQSGNRAIISAPNNNRYYYNGTINQVSGAGGAWIYEYNGSSWQETAWLSINESYPYQRNFGSSVAIEGDRIVVGARPAFWHHPGAGSGSAYIFEHNGSDWVQIAELKASDEIALDNFGVSVALSGDRVFVGATRGDTAGPGSVYVFEYNGSTWVETAKLMASDGFADARFGNSLSTTGDRVLVGASFDDDAGATSGAVYQYDFDGFNWNETKLLPSDLAAGDRFGQNVALTDTRVFASSLSDDGNKGSAYVFELGEDYVSKWEGEGNANDATGTNNGTLVGDVTFAPGVSGQAFQFDGNGTVQIPDSPSLDITGGMTVSAWFKADPPKPGVFFAHSMIATKSDGGNKGGFQIHLLGPQNRCVHSQQEECDGAVVLSFFGNGANTGVHATDVKYHDGQWHQVTGVLGDDGKARIYIDGVLKGEAVSALNFPVKTNNLPITIGNAPTPRTGDTNFFGLIDEVCIYDRSLSDTEVADLVGAGPPANNAPSANAGTDQTLECAGSTGTDVILDGSGSSDPDGDTLTYTWRENGNVIGTGATANVSLALGTHTIELTVDDGNGGTSTDEVVVAVEDTTPPTITLNGDALIAVICGDTYEDAGATATDLCDGDLTAAIKVGGSVDVTTPGTYTLAYKVKDSSGNFSEVINRTVEVINPAPELAAIGDQSVNEGETLDVAVSAMIVGNKGIVLSTSFGSLTDAGDGTGTLSFAPDFDAAGTYEVTVTAANATDENLTDSETFTLTVVNVNRAPSIAGPAGKPGDQTVDEGQTLVVNLIAADPDGNVPTLSTANLPGFATFTDNGDGTSSVSFAPDFDAAGGYADITVIASDGDLSDAVTFALQVNNVNRAPVAVAQHVELDLDALGAATLSADAVNNGSSDPDGDELTLSLSKTDFTCEDLGENTVTLTVSDGEFSVTADATVIVKDVTAPAIAEITAPMVLECTNPEGEPIALSVIASDVCDQELDIKWFDELDQLLGDTPEISVTFGMGAHTARVVITDDSGNASEASVDILVQDTTAPEVTAALEPTRKPSQKKSGKSKKSDKSKKSSKSGSNGYWHEVVAEALDICDEGPSVTAHITQPLTAADAYDVKYKKHKDNKIDIDISKKGIKVDLRGPDEGVLLSLLNQAIAQGGFGVVDGQVLVVKSKTSKDDSKSKKSDKSKKSGKSKKSDKSKKSGKSKKGNDDPREGKYRYEFDGSLTLTDADGLDLALVVTAEDGSGNVSDPVTAIPPKVRRSKPVLAKSAIVDEEAGGGLVFGASNYPNPFNPETAIQYTLPEGGDVRLVVYNTLGQQVRELVNASQAPGQYTVRWDSRDALGRSVSSGVYFYRLVAGEHVAIKKMLLLK